MQNIHITKTMIQYMELIKKEIISSFGSKRPYTKKKKETRLRILNKIEHRKYIMNLAYKAKWLDKT